MLIHINFFMQDGDSSAAGPVLDFLDKFALTSFNASQGKLTTDSYGEL